MFNFDTGVIFRPHGRMSSVMYFVIHFVQPHRQTMQPAGRRASGVDWRTYVKIHGK